MPDIFIKDPSRHRIEDVVHEMTGGIPRGRLRRRGVSRGGFGHIGRDKGPGRIYPYVKGVTRNNGAVGVVTPVTGCRDWGVFLQTGLQEEEVYFSDLMPAERHVIYNLKNSRHLSYPLRRIRVGVNIWLYLGDDDRLGERIQQRRKHRHGRKFRWH